MIGHFKTIIMKTIVYFAAILIMPVGCQKNNRQVVSNKIFTTIEDANLLPDSVSILRLQNSDYSSLPLEIGNFKNLRSISYTGSECDLPGLKCSNIDSIPDFLCNLKNLQELYFVKNSISYIPECLVNLNIRILDLSDNSEINFATIVNITSLEQLSLNGCQLNDIPLSIKNLKKLKILGLENNQIPPDKIEILRGLLPTCKIFI